MKSLAGYGSLVVSIGLGFLVSGCGDLSSANETAASSGDENAATAQQKIIGYDWYEVVPVSIDRVPFADGGDHDIYTQKNRTYGMYFSVSNVYLRPDGGVAYTLVYDARENNWDNTHLRYQQNHVYYPTWYHINAVMSDHTYQSTGTISITCCPRTDLHDWDTHYWGDAQTDPSASGLIQYVAYQYDGNGVDDTGNAHAYLQLVLHLDISF
jgi:hypothetical protein